MPESYISHQALSDAASDLNAQTFLIKTILARISTATLVRVAAVTNNGGIEPVGFVDIEPLVNQIDGAGNKQEHGTVFHCPYFRLQGGANAVILDPKVGDIGIAIFADRDISSVVATKNRANPGSRRKFDYADGIYIGGVINSVPNQIVRFSETGIEINSPYSINITAPAIIFTGTVTANGHRIDETHKHTGVQTGSSDTGVVV